jgi:hypothetical protein
MFFIILLLLLFTAIGFSPGGSSPYTSTHIVIANINPLKFICRRRVEIMKLFTMELSFPLSS